MTLTETSTALAATTAAQDARIAAEEARSALKDMEDLQKQAEEAIQDLRTAAAETIIGQVSERVSAAEATLGAMAEGRFSKLAVQLKDIVGVNGAYWDMDGSAAQAFAEGKIFEVKFAAAEGTVSFRIPAESADAPDGTMYRFRNGAEDDSCILRCIALDDSVLVEARAGETITLVKRAGAWALA